MRNKTPINFPLLCITLLILIQPIVSLNYDFRLHRFEQKKGNISKGEETTLSTNPSLKQKDFHSKLGANDKCPYTFKVYVYPLPPSIEPIQKAYEARVNKTFHVCQKCIYEQFALEYIVHDYFTQFCGRTYNSDEADFFYLPIVRDIEYRIALQTGKRAPSETDSLLIEALEKKNLKPWSRYLNVSAKYWTRNNGADHILVMPAPVTNFRHESSRRGFFHYMIQVLTYHKYITNAPLIT